MDAPELAKELPFLKIGLKEGIVLPECTQKFQIFRYVADDILDPNFMREMSMNNLSIRECQLFISPPNSIGKIHIDGHRRNLDAASINYVLSSSQEWTMEWFDSNTSQIKKNTSSGNTDYISLQESECRKIFEFKSDKPFIVQIGTAHRIINFSSAPRYCLSLRFIKNDFLTVLENANRYCTEI